MALRSQGIAPTRTAAIVLDVRTGAPLYAFNSTASLLPASVEKLAVSFSKGCYLGQEVVYMLENRGHVKRKLVPLDVDGAEVPVVGTAVTALAGDAVGEIRSAVLGPTKGTPVAIAMVKWAHAKPGTELRVGDRAARVR